MILSAISAIFPLACATAAFSWASSPSSPGRLPLQQRKAIDLNEVPLEQVADPFEFAIDQFNFSFLGLLLGGKTDNLLQQLARLLTQLSLLASAWRTGAVRTACVRLP